MKAQIILFVVLMSVVGGLYGTLRYLRMEKEKTLNEIAESDSTVLKPLTKEDSLKLALESYQKRIAGQGKPTG